MAALSHPAMRLLIEDFGGIDYYFSEMIDANALCAHTQYEKYYLSTQPAPDKMIFQLLGSDSAKMGEAAEILNSVDCAGIDINMGCSAPPITKKGGGIVWMEDIERAHALIQHIRPHISGKSLSVKLRIGFKHDTQYLTDFCQALEAAGIDFITIHPRTKKEKFKRLSRWEYVTLLQEKLNIPIIGNGDVINYTGYKAKLEQYHPHGIMIGRKLIRAPWFADYLRTRESGDNKAYTVNLFSTLKRFHQLLEEHQPADFYVSRCHRFYSYFHKNMTYGHAFFITISNMKKYDDIKNYVMSYFEERPHIHEYIEKE